MTTIEGLAPDGDLHPVQQAFWEAHGLQCGFCTPGMVLATCDLLSHTPNPTEAEIRHALEGNYCRCTGYHNIVQAVQLAASGRDPSGAAKGRDLRYSGVRQRICRRARPSAAPCEGVMAHEPYVGQPIKRVEDPRFLTGAGRYTDDLTLPGMLHVAMVRSPYAHAAHHGHRHVARRCAQPGVVAVITGTRHARREDRARCRSAGCCPISRRRRATPSPSTRVRHVGEIVAAVVAETRRGRGRRGARRRRLRPAPGRRPRLGSARRRRRRSCTPKRPATSRFDWSIGDKAETDAQFREGGKDRRARRCATAGSCRTPSSRARRSRSTRAPATSSRCGRRRRTRTSTG